MSKVTVVSRPNRITIASKGVQGAPGPDGPQGIQGPKGDTGDVTPEALAARDAAQEAASAAAQSAADAAAIVGPLAGVVDRMAVANTDLLATLSGASPLDTARVVDARDGGYWQWQTGDVSALVAADPYGALWRPPSAAPSGASGAWMRIVDDGIFDSEWVLPDVMPANAQVRLNAMIPALPAGARRLMLPRRQVNVTGSIHFSKGIEYFGGGRSAPINGGGGNFITVFVTADGARVHNVSAGNVQGQVVYSEAAGFIVHDGAPPWQSSRAPKDVSFHNCHSFDAEVGLSVTVSALNRTTGGSPSTEHDVLLFAPRDVYVENFMCEGVERIGIEVMRANNVDIRGGKLRMKMPSPASGFDRGIRIAGAHNVHVSGVHVVSPASTTVYGISVEHASQGGGGSFAYTFGGSSNVTVENCTMEDCQIGGAVSGGFSRNVKFANNRIIGRRDSYASSAFLVEGNATSNGFPLDVTPQLNVQILDNEAINVANFVRLSGYTYGTKIRRNVLITNSATAVAFAQTFAYGNIPASRHRELEIIGNSGYRSAAVNTATVMLTNLDAQTTITCDDNSFSASGNGRTFDFAGDATVYMRGDGGNKLLPAGAWAMIKPPLDQEDYPVGDGDFIQGAY